MNERTQTEEANISSTSTSAASNDIDDDLDKLEQDFQVDNIEHLIVDLEKDIENSGEGSSASNGSKPSSSDKQQITHDSSSKQNTNTFSSNPLTTNVTNTSLFFKSSTNPSSSTKNVATSSTTGTVNTSSNPTRASFDNSQHNSQLQSHQRKQIFGSTDPTHKSPTATDQRSKTYTNTKVATSSHEDKTNDKDTPNAATTLRQPQNSHSSRPRCSEGEREGLKMKIMRDVKPGKREHKIVSPDLNTKLPKVVSTCPGGSNKGITTSTSDPGFSSTDVSQNKSKQELSLEDNMPSSRENKISIDNPKVTVIEKNGCQTNTSGDINSPANRKKGHEPLSSISSTKECGTSTSIGTITDPDCLGPCEPGTSVTLEGIVWQETEGGILVVNVTWRGKTYVGTLLDCTKHDWAPPRLCESPASDIDSKTNKSVRTKRIATRSVGMGLDERALVQTTGKLRNGKGRRIPNPNDASVNNKRQKKSVKPSDVDFMNESSNQDQDAATKGALNDDNATENDAICVEKTDSSCNAEVISDTAAVCNGIENIDNKSKELVHIEGPLVIDESRIVDENSKTTQLSTSEPATLNNGHHDNLNCVSSEESCPASPKLINCSELNCSKKYRDSNALLFHQSHAHGGSVGTLIETTSDDTLTPSHETLVQSKKDANESTSLNSATDSQGKNQKSVTSKTDQAAKQDSPTAYSDISDVDDSDRAINKNIQSDNYRSCSKQNSNETPQVKEKIIWDRASSKSSSHPAPPIENDDPYVYNDAPTPPSMNPYNNGRSMQPNNGRNLYQPNKINNDSYPMDIKSQQSKHRQSSSNSTSKNFHNDMHESLNRRNDQNFTITQQNLHIQDNHNPASLSHSSSSHSSRRGNSNNNLESNQTHNKHQGSSHTIKNTEPVPPPLPPTQEEGMKPSGTSTGPPPAPHSSNYYFNSSIYNNGAIFPFDPILRFRSMLSNYPPGPPNTSPTLIPRFVSGSPPTFVPPLMGSHMGPTIPPNLSYPPQTSPLSSAPGHPSRHLRLPGTGPPMTGPSQTAVGQPGMPNQPHVHPINSLGLMNQPVPSLVDDPMHQYARNLPR